MTKRVATAEIHEMREMHYPERLNGVMCCGDCLDPYPCPTIRAIDELESLRAVVRCATEYLDREDAWRVGADDADTATHEKLSRRVIFARAELRSALAAAEEG